MRGVRESVLVLTPIFLIFVVCHAFLIVGGITSHAPALPATLETARTGFSGGLATLGLGGMVMLFIHAYSLGGGTYTGIEAVSNGLAIMREPRVRTGKRTMLYMAVSLAFTASGLLLCYLLWDVFPADGKTMNAVLAEKFAGGSPWGTTFVITAMISEGALLVVAAQAGFVDGPRVLGNMAVDSWVPRRFAAFSDRLATQNGILLMGLTSLGALFCTGGNTRNLVIMYSINVFITFSMTEVAMCRLYFGGRRKNKDWMRKISIHVVGLLMCLTILAITVFEKFLDGGWVTLAVTGSVILLCLLVRRHYTLVTAKLGKLYKELENIPGIPGAPAGAPDPSSRVAAVLVYGGLGLHTFLSTFREFPGQFKGVIFLSAGVVDSREFKGEGTLEALSASIEGDLKRYVDFARSQGFPAAYRFRIGTDAAEEAEQLCLEVSAEFTQVTFFAGKVVFQKEKWYQGVLHNETALALQKRLQWAGKTLVVVPARVT